LEVEEAYNLSRMRKQQKMPVNQERPGFDTPSDNHPGRFLSFFSPPARRETEVHVKKSTVPVSLASAGERDNSCFQIEDYYDRDQEMTNLLLKVQNITLSNIINRNPK
jgi:hypothetical protein